MTSGDRSIDGFNRRWVRSTTVGWLLGLAVTVVLAILGDMVTSGEGGSQFMIGVGIGGGVGFAQARALRGLLGRPMRWMVASTVGMGALFVLHDVATAVGRDVPYSLPVYVVAGSVLTGIWQGVLLRPRSERAHWWLGGSVVGWGVPALCLALGDWPAAGPMGDLASLCAIFLGGGMLGAATGGVLRSILAGHGTLSDDLPGSAP